MTETQVNERFEQEALKKLSGGDHYYDEDGEKAAGSLDNPSIWCFGIEHGTWSPLSEEENKFDDSYSVEQQMQWPYNRKLFKLLAAIHGQDIANYQEFANHHKPFVKGSPGFFKGNLYPYGFRSVQDYTEEAQREIGLQSKDDYYAWCNAHRLPAIREWVEEYQPKMFIGIGISCASQFATAVFGEGVELSEKTITINNHTKRLYSHVQGWKKLVVVPHFSGPYGLNSNQSIKESGEYIREIMDS